MTDLAKLVVRLEAQTAQYQKELEKANKKLDRFGQKAKKTVSGINVTLSGLAVGALTGKIIQATAKQEAAVRQLEQGLATTGQVVGFSLSQLTAQASELQKATTFGDEDIIRAQSQLVTFTKITGEEFKRTTELALDLSERFGTDLKSSALQLGKALNDPVTNLSALSRAGIQFSADQKEVIKSLVESGKLQEAQKIILKELEVQFGGSAKAAGQTFGGALKGLGNDLGDLLEANNGLPAATKAVTDLRAVVSSEQFKESFNAISSGAINAVSSLLSFVPRVTAELQKLGVRTAFFVESSIAAGKAVSEAVTLGDGIGFKEAQERFRARMESLKKIRDDSLSDINTEFTSGAIQGTGAQNEGALSAAPNNEQQIQAAVESEKQRLEAVAALKEEFRVAEEEAETERRSLKDEEKLTHLTSELDHFQSHQQALTGILFSEVSKRTKFETVQQRNVFNQQRNLLAGALQYFSQHSKKMFKIQKIAGYANAVVSTARGVAKALELPFPANIVAAAKTAIVGTAQISKINSQSFSSGGSVASIPSGGTVAASTAVAPSNIEGLSKSQEKTFNINVKGDGSGLYSAKTIRALMEKFGEQLGDGVNMNLEFT